MSAATVKPFKERPQGDICLLFGPSSQRCDRSSLFRGGPDGGRAGLGGGAAKMARLVESLRACYMHAISGTGTRGGGRKEEQVGRECRTMRDTLEGLGGKLGMICRPRHTVRMMHSSQKSHAGRANTRPSSTPSTLPTDCRLCPCTDVDGTITPNRRVRRPIIWRRRRGTDVVDVDSKRRRRCSTS